MRASLPSERELLHGVRVRQDDVYLCATPYSASDSASRYQFSEQVAVRSGVSDECALLWGVCVRPGIVHLFAGPATTCADSAATCADSTADSGTRAPTTSTDSTGAWDDVQVQERRVPRGRRGGVFGGVQ